MSDLLVGVFRGVVAANNDPEMRKRYRVRVHTLHAQEIPDENLPWAESAMFVGKMFGDLFAFEPGDPVFVMFEGGKERFPVIVGGAMSASAGVPDAPSEISSDYNRTQMRWLRLDRIGNKIEMSPLDDERWIVIQAGQAEIKLRMNDGSVSISGNSRIEVEAPQVSVLASEQATVQTAVLIAQVSDTATIRCDDVVNIQGASEINIGRYEDPILGPLKTQTSDLVDIRANDNIKVESGGTIDVDAVNNITVDTESTCNVTAQTQLNLRGVSKATVTSDGDVEVQADGKVKVDSEDNVEVTTDQKVTINGATQVEITGQQGVVIKASAQSIEIKADAGAVNVESATSVNVKANTTATLESTAALTLKSNSQIKIEAPIVEITAQAKASVNGGSLAEIQASAITIG